ncbi:MAG TPA: amidohydrolase family protein [Gemmatimonadales bacterium]
MPSADLALEHVTVLDVLDGERRRDLTILVEGTRIVAVAPSSRAEVPAGTRAVDGSGWYVIPGLWDAHVHSAWNTAWHFPLLVAHGITGVRNMHTSVDTALELTRAVARRVASGELLGPRFLANGPIVDGDPSVQDGSVTARTPAEGRAIVDSLARAGADFIKVYSNLSREVYLAIAAQARLRGIPLDGHVPFQVRSAEAAAAGQRTSEHLFGLQMGCSRVADSLRAEHARLMAPGTPLPPEQVEDVFFGLIHAASATRNADTCAETIQAYRRHGVAVVPTLAALAAFSDPAAVLADTARMRLVPEEVRRQWGRLAKAGVFEGTTGTGARVAALENLRLLHAAGVRILAGTDLGNPFLVPGASLHDELLLLAEAGLSPLEALQAATVEPARVLGLGDSVGRVAVGMLADLVLLEADPLDDLRHTRRIIGVVVNGRYLDRRELDELVQPPLVDSER